MLINKKLKQHAPAPAQDILLMLDVILQIINVIEAINRLINNFLTRD